MKKSLATLCLILWMVVPVASLAADALVNFVPNQCPANTGPANAPQGTAAPNNQMKLIVKARDVGNNPMPQLKTVDVGQILLESCDIPSYVAKKSQDAICAAAALASNGYACVGSIDGPTGVGCQSSPPAGMQNCCDIRVCNTMPGLLCTSDAPCLATGGTCVSAKTIPQTGVPPLSGSSGASHQVEFTCRIPAGIGTATESGFTVNKSNGGSSVTVSDFTNSFGNLSKVQGLNSSTNAGNSIQPDLLPQYIVQVSPNGVHGVVTFRVFHGQGGTNPRSFTVNTSSFGSDSQGLHNAIKTGFDQTGLGLVSDASQRTIQFAQSPDAFAPGSAVRISNAQTVQKFEVTGLPGQTITQETSIPNANAFVPALSPWGVALLIGLLLLTGLWMMHRRSWLSESAS